MYSHLQQESWTLRYLKVRPLDYYDMFSQWSEPTSHKKAYHEVNFGLSS